MMNKAKIKPVVKRCSIPKKKINKKREAKKLTVIQLLIL